MTTPQPTIIYTLTDEAPLLATCAFLPIVRAFTAPAGIRVQESDISVAARVLAEFPEGLLNSASSGCDGGWLCAMVLRRPDTVPPVSVPDLTDRSRSQHPAPAGPVLMVPRRHGPGRNGSSRDVLHATVSQGARAALSIQMILQPAMAERRPPRGDPT